MEIGIGNRHGISGNGLKIIAALSMLIDHAGLMLFPRVGILRILGRIAFPVYAFMIAEGCAHTKNKLRYFLTVFLLGAVCQSVYCLYDDELFLGILITFSIAILLVYAMEYWKKVLFSPGSSAVKRWVVSALFLSAVGGVYALNQWVHIDYGFWGCMAPAFASAFRRPAGDASQLWGKLDCHQVHVIMLSLCLVLISGVLGGIQPYSLLAAPLLLAYSGKRGKLKMKYFFYIFYPAHLVALECIAYLLR